jgi:hypothetical protein
MDCFCPANPTASADEKVGHNFFGYGLGLFRPSGDHLFSGASEKELALGFRDVDESHLLVHRSLSDLSLPTMAGRAVNSFGR